VCRMARVKEREDVIVLGSGKRLHFEVVRRIAFWSLVIYISEWCCGCADFSTSQVTQSKKSCDSTQSYDLINLLKNFATKLLQ